MRIALGQLASGTDTAANLDAIDAFTAGAAAAGADLVAFPEYATYEKKAIDGTFPQVAEPLDGPVGARLAATARRHGIALVAGVVEQSPDPARAYNTLAAFDAAGTLSGAYRKIHLFDAQGFHESRHIAPGPSTRPVVFTVHGVPVGLMACYDLRFPEQARMMSDAGARLALVCASWVPGEVKTRQWTTLLAARAIENGIYVAGVCQAPPVSVGHSLVADPMGTVRTELGGEVGLAFADVSMAEAEDVRDRFPMHRQRRID
ncbi:carbon-nitrogen hydrolase family protein [Specibacter cremeus]|uniref:carbon-nitrogen hydrolase family protein n=1 Tax=Specibacter cremeus TaxID=1629051 RepID=UPI000F78BF53|nr:carbon-nitrogen hydrolase family protein [Specibacter cremeus]